MRLCEEITTVSDDDLIHRLVAVSSGVMVPASSSTFQSGQGKCFSALAKALAQIIGL